MATILLTIIYIAAVGLGLPDALLGAAWPSMVQEMEGALGWAGAISMVISAGTIVSILYSHRLIRVFGTGKVTVISVGMTGLALMGFSMSRNFWHLCLWAVPYGLGAGCVDVAVNSYVALHYKSRHMSWLHCLWGVGAAVGPLIMGKCLTASLNWTGGYQITGILQIALTMILFIALPFWEKGDRALWKRGKYRRDLTFREIVRRPGAGALMISFFCYGALEITIGLWTASYMVLCKDINASRAASLTALFYLGIVMGRFLAGFVADRIKDKNMIRIGQLLTALGFVCLVLPGYEAFWMEGLLLLGMGLSPMYPGLLHAIPEQFGAERAEEMMSVQIVCAYVGSILMPPLFGILAEVYSVGIFPRYLLILQAVLIIMTERVNCSGKKKAADRIAKG